MLPGFPPRESPREDNGDSEHGSEHRLLRTPVARVSEEQQSAGSRESLSPPVPDSTRGWTDPGLRPQTLRRFPSF